MPPFLRSHPIPFPIRWRPRSVTVVSKSPQTPTCPSAEGDTLGACLQDVETGVRHAELGTFWGTSKDCKNQTIANLPRLTPKRDPDCRESNTACLISGSGPGLSGTRLSLRHVPGPMSVPSLSFRLARILVAGRNMQWTAKEQNDSRLGRERRMGRLFESRGTRPSLSRRVARLALAQPERSDRLFSGLTIREGDCVLDLGCADASLLTPLARLFPRARFVGLDPDDRALELARAHLDAAGLDVELRRGLIFAPPFPPSTFHHVVSALLLHRLTIREKVLAIGAAYRLLKPGGTLHLIDWGRPQGCVAGALVMARRLVRGLTVAPPAIDRLLLAMLRDTGFVRATIEARQRTPWGTMYVFTGRRPCTTCAFR